MLKEQTTGSVIEIKAKDQEEKERLLAELHLNPIVTNANAIKNITKAEELELVPLISAMQAAASVVNKGSLDMLEQILVSQVQVLNAMFAKSASKWAVAEYLNQSKAHGAMALKAQNLSRMTVATLATLKNPKKTTFIKNTAHNQQVNFGKNLSPEPPNELLSGGPQNMKKHGTQLQLEEQYHEALDTGGTAAAGGTDPAMAALEGSRG